MYLSVIDEALLAETSLTDPENLTLSWFQSRECAILFLSLESVHTFKFLTLIRKSG